MQRKLFSFHGNHLDSELRCVLSHIHDLIYFPQGKSFIFKVNFFFIMFSCYITYHFFINFYCRLRQLVCQHFANHIKTNKSWQCWIGQTLSKTLLTSFILRVILLRHSLPCSHMALRICPLTVLKRSPLEIILNTFFCFMTEDFLMTPDLGNFF
jgi:hypothetical protein